MTEEMKTIVSVAIGILIAVFFNRKFYKGGTKREKFIEEAKAKGNVVRAKCVKSRRNLPVESSDNDVYRYEGRTVTYEYVINGKKYSKRLFFQSPGKVSVDYPYEISVYYSEKNPRKAYAREEMNEKRRGCLLTLIVFIVSVAVILNLIK